MSVTSGRNVGITFQGDVEYSQTFSAADVSTGSGQNQLQSLVSGANEIIIPANAVAVTIIPLNNDGEDPVEIILKGDGADIGVTLHPSDPTSIGLGSSNNFILTVDDDLTVRLIYS